MRHFNDNTILCFNGEIGEILVLFGWKKCLIWSYVWDCYRQRIAKTLLHLHSRPDHQTHLCITKPPYNSEQRWPWPDCMDLWCLIFFFHEVCEMPKKTCKFSVQSPISTPSFWKVEPTFLKSWIHTCGSTKYSHHKNGSAKMTKISKFQHSLYMCVIKIAWRCV